MRGYRNNHCRYGVVRGIRGGRGTQQYDQTAVCSHYKFRNGFFERCESYFSDSFNSKTTSILDLFYLVK